MHKSLFVMHGMQRQKSAAFPLNKKPFWLFVRLFCCGA